MDNKDEATSLLEEYFGIDLKRVLVFFGLVLGVFVVITGIYVSIFGMDTWKSSMSQAGSLMLANFDQPATGADGVVRPFAPAAAQTATQYSCNQCGALGLPLWDPNGTPLCPSCGAVMNMTSTVMGGAHLAAAP